MNEIFDGTAATGQYARVTASQRTEAEDDNDDGMGDPEQVPRSALGLGPDDSFNLDDLYEDSQPASLEISTTASTTLATTPAPSTPTLSNASKRRLRASDVIGRRVRQKGDNGFNRLADAVIEREYNIPGGNAKEDAITVFQNDYENVLESDEFYVVLDKFNNPQNVITFNALKPGERRDGWIRHLARV